MVPSVVGDAGGEGGGGQAETSPWENRFVIAVLLLIGLLGAVAGLIAATGSSDRGWLTFLGLAIAAIFVAAAALGLLAVFLRKAVVPAIGLFVVLVREDKAPGLLPAFLAALQGVFIAANDEILSNDPGLRFALAAIIPMISFLGALFAELHKDNWMTVLGFLLVAVSAAPVVIVAFTNKQWWSHFQSSSATNQIAIIGVVVISIAIPIASICLSRRNRPSKAQKGIAVAAVD